MQHSSLLNEDRLKADRQILSETRLILVGFGAQGEAEATNLRRSEIPFELALRSDGKSAAIARSAGFTVADLDSLDVRGGIVVMNLPDDQQKAVYERYRFEHAKALLFAHGFNTTFKLIPVLEQGPQHWLVAPKGAASGLKDFYGTANALPAILAIESPASEPASTAATSQARALLEAYARAIGCHAQFLVWARFKDETVCDLFSEQALLCGGVSSLLRKSFEVLVEAGYKPETAYFETLFELKLIVDLIWKRGITGMREKISPTARYGDITRGDRIIDDGVKARMKDILGEIESGHFAREFLSENQSENYRKLSALQAQHALEKIGAKIRS